MQRAAGEVLQRFEGLQPLVLALPRGGVPVACEVCHELGAALEALVVRKLGLRRPELGMGAIASRGAVVLNLEVMTHFAVAADELEVEATARRAKSPDA